MSAALAILVAVLAVVAWIVRPDAVAKLATIDRMRDQTSASAGTKRLVARAVATEPNPQDAIEDSASAEDSATSSLAAPTTETEATPLASVTVPTTTTTTTPAPPAFDAEVACALAQEMVAHPLPNGWSVRCVADHDLLGETLDHVIILSPRAWDRPEFWAGTYAHEMGHVWYGERVTFEEHDEWGRSRGFTPWDCTPQGCGGDDQATIEEDFADSFACALGDQFCFRVYGGPVPTAEQVALLWSLVG